ncbi:hypothetical protein EDB19DRAFT_1837349 [Suillus lakei]|nr:hypothetical protein EDB19DRAFT_1837349 [Suillus lakei]
MSETPPTQGVRNAKKNALKNAVWLPEKTCTNDTASLQCEPQWGSQLQLKPKSTKKRKKREDKVVTKRQSPDMPSSQGEPQWGSQPRSQSKPKSTKKCYHDEDEAVKCKRLRLDAKKSSGHTTQQLTSIKEDRLEQSGSEEAGNHTDSDQTDFASDAKDLSNDSNFEDPTSITKMLSTEIPSFVSSSKAKNPPVNKQSAHDHKQAAERPVWANDLMVSESEESCNDSAPKSNGDTSTFISTLTSYQSIGCSEASSMANSQAKSKQPLTKARIVKAESKQDFSDAEDKSDTSSVTGSRSSLRPSGSSSAKLILTEHRKAAHDCCATSIETQIKTNDAYASALTTLVEAQVPLFHGDLKDDACVQVAAYLHLGSNSIASSKAFIEDHSYHYFMQFGDNNVPKPVRHKPYLGDLMVHLMKGCYFNGLKSVGATFAQKFTNIVKNKANQPEVPIPMVALTSTLVYAALFWKSQGSPSKFNFTGNQFSEVYVFHVQFHEDLKANTPQKFHKLMADIFATIQDLMHTKKAVADLTTNALTFLDLNGMEE